MGGLLAGSRVSVALRVLDTEAFWAITEAEMARKPQIGISASRMAKFTSLVLLPCDC